MCACSFDHHAGSGSLQSEAVEPMPTRTISFHLFCPPPSFSSLRDEAPARSRGAHQKTRGSTSAKPEKARRIADSRGGRSSFWVAFLWRYSTVRWMMSGHHVSDSNQLPVYARVFLRLLAAICKASTLLNSHCAAIISFRTHHLPLPLPLRLLRILSIAQQLGHSPPSSPNDSKFALSSPSSILLAQMPLSRLSTKSIRQARCH